jgi:hypothetical protein
MEEIYSLSRLSLFGFDSALPGRVFGFSTRYVGISFFSKCCDSELVALNTPETTAMECSE